MANFWTEQIRIKNKLDEISKILLVKYVGMRLTKRVFGKISDDVVDFFVDNSLKLGVEIKVETTDYFENGTLIEIIKNIILKRQD